MDLDTSVMANAIHAVCTRLGFQIDSEKNISRCFNNPTDDRSRTLIETLNCVLSHIHLYTSPEPKIFWKTIKDILKKAIFMMELNYEIKLDQPAVTRTLRKSESSKDVRFVLRTTHLHCPVPFWFAAPGLYDSSVRKLSEGSFAEVFGFQKEEEERILKLIPVGDVIPRSEFVQLTFKDMTAEIYISQELSQLSKGTQYRCPTYPTIYKISVVQDKFPEPATKAWKRYNNGIRRSGHPCPNCYPSDQAYITIETGDVGLDLDNSKIGTFSIALSIFQQVAAGIAVAEEKLQFEHRDLHLGNILLKPCSEDKLVIKLRSKRYLIETFGIKASIIDFTYSRMTTDEGTKYLELEDIYDAKPRAAKEFLDHRYIYAKMANLNE